MESHAPSLLQSILLGLIQGFTEFFPVSSSGHLAIAEKLFGLSQPGVLLEVLLHLGTLAAVIFLLRKELLRLIIPGKLPLRQQLRILLILAIATFPAAIGGFFAEQMISKLFDSMQTVGISLLFTGTILFGTKYLPRPQNSRPISRRQAFFVGAAQCLALVPGISRSGMTISAGLAAGLAPGEAARFSFLLSIPIIAGAAGVEILGARNAAVPPFSFDLPIAVGILTSALAGFAALRWLVSVINKGRLHHFSYYCWGLGFLVLVFSWK